MGLMNLYLKTEKKEHFTVFEKGLNNKYLLI